MKSSNVRTLLALIVMLISQMSFASDLLDVYQEALQSDPIFQAATGTYKANVKSAAASYDAAAQSLIIRVAQAYLNILLAEDNLRFTQAQKRALERQMNQAQQRYKVGLNTMTDVYQAQAAYDLMVAQEIS